MREVAGITWLTPFFAKQKTPAEFICGRLNFLQNVGIED